MVVVVIALAETDEGDHPAVSAAVLRAVGLPAHHMAEGIDREGRIEDHEHPEQAAHEEAADAPQKGAVPPEPNAKWNHQTGHNNWPVVLVLPENHRVSAQSNFIFAEPMRRLVEEPATVAVPESFGRIVGIFVRVRTGVMADMVRTPNQCRVLQRPPAGNQRQTLHPIGAVETLMRHQPVIADRDPHPRHNVHDEKVHPVKQRIADIVSIEGNPDDRDGGKGTEEEARGVGKSYCQGLGDPFRLGHVSSC